MECHNSSKIARDKSFFQILEAKRELWSYGMPQFFQNSQGQIILSDFGNATRDIDRPKLDRL